MSTEKSLKHLKSKDEFLMTNISTYFEKHSGRDGSSYIQHTVQATGVSREPFSEYEKNFEKPVHFSRRKVRNGDNTNLWMTLLRLLSEKNVQEFYTHPHQLPTINNLLSVLKTDIMSTIH